MNLWIFVCVCARARVCEFNSPLRTSKGSSLRWTRSLGFDSQSGLKNVFLLQHPHRFQIPMLTKGGPPIELPSLWACGCKQNDALWGMLSLRLSRPISAPFLTAIQGTCGYPHHSWELSRAPAGTRTTPDSYPGHLRVPAPLLTAIQGTCGYLHHSWQLGVIKKKDCYGEATTLHPQRSSINAPSHSETY